MAYKKEYPVVNSELEKDSIFEYTKRQEDRIDTSFAGVIPEIGSNSNGTYIKYPNGLLICTHWERRRDVDMTVEMHSLYREDAGYIWTYPHKFSNFPSLSIEPLSGLGNGKYISGNNVEYATYRSTATVAVKRDVEFSYLAIGMWK